MNQSIAAYLKSGVEPWPDQIYGEGYRCSARLTDGTFLPCVMLRRSEATVELAMRRFEEEKRGKGVFRTGGSDAYKSIVRNFTAGGNRVNAYDIETVEPSRFAIPLSLLKQIEGETTMAWTGFVFEMRDGQRFAYGTSFGVEFFNLPNGYEFTDVLAVHNHSYLSSMGELRSLTQDLSPQPVDYEPRKVLRERPYFICHFDA
jgi:hypothetical protein